MLSVILRFFQTIFARRSPPNGSDTPLSPQPLPPQYQSSSINETLSPAAQTLAWGAKVSATFRRRVYWIADALKIDPNWLMACMAFESAETFRADIKNMAGSGATGLIQFMPTTAIGLGTSVGQLAAMSAENQLNFVYKYLRPYAEKMHSLDDVYMAILWPAAVGKPPTFVLFSKATRPTTYRQNAGLDYDQDGNITKKEAAKKVQDKLAMGMTAANSVTEPRYTEA